MIRKINAIFGLFLGIAIAFFGVFFFNFVEFLSYDGRFLVDIFAEIIKKPSVGLYEFTWMSFRFNIFNFAFVLPLPQISNKILYLVEYFLPVFLTWFSCGLITGLLVIGAKRGVLFSFIILSLLVILWLCFAVISGANITFVFIQNIFETGGGILTALLSVLTGGSIGGSISAAISNRMIKIHSNNAIPAKN